MKKLFYVVLVSLFSLLTLSAHPWKPRHFIIIDTDGGIDDFRSISMLLASPDVRVLGITITPGALSSREIHTRIVSMLRNYHHEGISVGINETSEIKPAGFAGAKNFSWGEDTIASKSKSAFEVIQYLYKNSSDSIHFVCLGSLNIIDVAQQTEGFKKTAQIIWSCNNFNRESCFNYSVDKGAYKRTLKLPVPLRMIDGKSIRGNIFQNLSLTLGQIPVVYAKEISRSMNLEHKMYYDEVIPLWLHYPQFFMTRQEDNLILSGLKSDVTDKDIQEAFVKIVSGETVNQNQVINFSWRKEDYFDDVQPIMDETIKRFGKAEWVAEVMANELHRHLGVFAIVGTKMGVRAKEYFNAGVDEMKIVSYAGLIPPFSCMNDGLQVSTGATVGHGLISVAKDTVVRPVADFTYMGRTIRVSLKPEYGKKIASEVKELNAIYGLNSDIYWELIRKLAIKYWANFDRYEVFSIVEI